MSEVRVQPPTTPKLKMCTPSVTLNFVKSSRLEISVQQTTNEPDVPRTSMIIHLHVISSQSRSWTAGQLIAIFFFFTVVDSRATHCNFYFSRSWTAGQLIAIFFFFFFSL